MVVKDKLEQKLKSMAEGTEENTNGSAEQPSRKLR
jgi:hypothetical protein